jgi:hypothetical protein
MSSRTAKAGKPTRLWSRCARKAQRVHTYRAPISAFELGNPDIRPSEKATVSESGIAEVQVIGATPLDISVSYNPSRSAPGSAASCADRRDCLERLPTN